MTQDTIREEYFAWLYDIVCDCKRAKGVSYKKLLRQLHDTEFTFIIDRDEDRAESGVGLRYRFIVTHDLVHLEDRILDYLDGPCSVLEMMVALALSCEEDTMDDTSYGDRTGQWFWGMMVSLGIGSITDNRYDRHLVNDVLTRFLDREYEPNGKGGLFTIKDCDIDLRNVEIWAQLNWYLNSIM